VASAVTRQRWRRPPRTYRARRAKRHRGRLRRLRCADGRRRNLLRQGGPRAPALSLQDSGAATRWVRVAQRSTRGGMGIQFLPRIGQKVLLQFIENDIDRKIVALALYNGQGEGGITPTPGCAPDAGDSQAACSNQPTTTPSPCRAIWLPATARCGTARRATAPVKGAATHSVACAARSSAAPATTSCCWTTPTPRAASSSKAGTRPANCGSATLLIVQCADAQRHCVFRDVFLRVLVRVGRWAIRVSTSIHAGFSS
jgi:hypothetical protein